ncbi:MAG TPA: DUF4097 family beta strand repeat-containing protein [Ktedonobacteraceae bacterium]|nr:DUF4097 family beta strand repeat-containing protein [Ktedonobacteraceae bacterium]
MSNQESAFTEPERRVYEARNINSDPREQGQQYQPEYPQTYGGSGQQQVGEKLYAPRNRRPRHRGLLLILALLVLIVLVGGGILSQTGISIMTQRSTSTHSFANVSHPKLVIRDSSGTIHIHSGGSSNSVIVTETKFATGLGVNLNNMHVDYTRDGNTIDVTAQSDSFFSLGSRDIDLDITAPNASDMVINTGSGQVEVDDITGQVQVETGSGSINANNLNGSATLKTGSGTITVGGLVGQANMNTGSGDIEVKEAKLSGQSIMKTGSGSIDFNGSIDPAGSYDFNTGSGTITVALPASSAFKLDATTDSGTVTNDFGSNSVGNGSQAGLQLHTGSGDISLRKN